MKKTIYTCDGRDCNNEVSEAANWLSIGSESADLYVVNNLPERSLISMNNCGDIHFCSKECFINCFIGPDKTKKDLLFSSVHESIMKARIKIKVITNGSKQGDVIDNILSDLSVSAPEEAINILSK